MGAVGWAGRLASWPICLTILAGCSCASSLGIKTPDPTGGVATFSVAPPGASPIITPTSAPPTAATPAPSALVCILEMPAQHEGDDTPITFVNVGMDAEQCALELAKMNDPVHGSATQGAAKIVYAIPAGPPMCSGTRPDGWSYSIYGTVAAMQACGA
jgi:hypothetical protein